MAPPRPARKVIRDWLAAPADPKDKRSLGERTKAWWDNAFAEPEDEPLRARWARGDWYERTKVAITVLFLAGFAIGFVVFAIAKGP